MIIIHIRTQNTLYLSQTRDHLYSIAPVCVLSWLNYPYVIHLSLCFVFNCPILVLINCLSFIV
jgi:hypothetical protein